MINYLNEILTPLGIRSTLFMIIVVDFRDMPFSNASNSFLRVANCSLNQNKQQVRKL